MLIMQLNSVNISVVFCSFDLVSIVILRTEMYVGRVPFCPLVSHVEYAPRALLRLEKTGQTDGQTDGRQTVTLRLPLNAASVIRASFSTAN